MNTIVLMLTLISSLALLTQHDAGAQNATAFCDYNSCYKQGISDGQNSNSSAIQQCSTPSSVNLYNATDVAVYCYGFRTGQMQALEAQNTSTSNQQSTAFNGIDFGNFNDLANIPVIGGMIAQHSVHTGILHNEQGVFAPWSVICNQSQQFLLQPCSNLVNPDGSLTSQGDTTVGCIRNGLAATLFAQKQLGLSTDLIKSALGAAAGLTGCGNIVDLNQIQNAPYFQQILTALEQMVP